MYWYYGSYSGGCPNGQHVFYFTSTATNANEEPLPFQVCACGRFTWQQVKNNATVKSDCNLQESQQ